MNSTANVLWTGGWDSSFRVIYLSMVLKKHVIPHYIINLKRKSCMQEMIAMQNIRNSIKEIDGVAATRIAPLRLTLADDTACDSTIRQHFKNMKSQSFLGGQYKFLAQYAIDSEIDGLELSVHVDDKIFHFLDGNIEQKEDGSYRLKDYNGKDVEIFSRFSFPLIYTKKTEMRRIAHEHGFITALENAWFCHEPINEKPCGLCNPCIYTIEEGLGYRLPASAMFRYRTRNIRATLKKISSLPKRGLRRLRKILNERKVFLHA